MEFTFTTPCIKPRKIKTIQTLTNTHTHTHTHTHTYTHTVTHTVTEGYSASVKGGRQWDVKWCHHIVSPHGVSLKRFHCDFDWDLLHVCACSRPILWPFSSTKLHVPVPLPLLVSVPVTVPVPVGPTNRWSLMRIGSYGACFSDWDSYQNLTIGE